MMKTKRRKKVKLNKKQRFIVAGAVLLFLVLFAIIFGISQSSSKGRISPNPLLEYDKDVAFGIDISEYNGELDWQAIKDNVDFVIVRVGYTGYGDGESYIDEYVYDNLQKANDYDIPVGVYYYSQAISEKEATLEAKNALSIICDYDISLPVFIDFEYPVDNGQQVGRLVQADLDENEKTNIINSFCSTVSKAGYETGVYSSSSIFYNDILVDKLDDNAFLWVADYNNKITFDVEYDIWQYSSDGKIESITNKDLDFNYWYIKK